MAEDREPQTRVGLARAALRWVGAAGLLVAMASDALAVLGRHAGFAVPGSIEIFQMSIVVAISCALLLTSFDRRHASVDVLTARASAAWLRRLNRGASAALALSFALILAASALAIHDLWDTGEATEILALPVGPFRIIWAAAMLAGTIHFALDAVRGWLR